MENVSFRKQHESVHCQTVRDSLTKLSFALFNQFLPSWTVKGMLEIGNRVPGTIVEYSAEYAVVGYTEPPAFIPISYLDHLYGICKNW